MNTASIKHFSIFLLIMIVGAGIYSNTLDGPFVFDDTIRIKDNPHIRATHLTEIVKAGFKNPSSRPIPFISFALNYYFHQYDLKGYHILNIIIHVLTGIFLFFFIKTTLTISSGQSFSPPVPRYFDASFIALGAALLWLVNPVHTQSVTYIVQRMNSMAAMFSVLSLFLYVKGRIHQRAFATQNLQNTAEASSENQKPSSGFRRPGFGLYFPGSALAWLLALGCKETAVTLPFFVFLYEWYFFQGLSRDWLKRHLKYFLGIAVLFGLIAAVYMGSSPLEKITSIRAYKDKYFTFTERGLTQPRVVIYYLSLLFYPHPSRLNLDYDFPLSHSLIDPATTMLSFVGIIGLIGLAVFIARKERLISFCILWFFGNLVIESSVIPLDIIYEHRTYLPSMLVCLMIVTLASRYVKPKWLLYTIFCAAVMICSVWTYQRNEVWRDPATLWKDCVEKSPQKARPHVNLGAALESKGIIKDAILQYSEALRIKPDLVEAHFNLGNVLKEQGNRAEAIRHYSEALRINPGSAKAHNNLGLVLEEQGDNAEAIRHYYEAVKIKPYYAKAHNNLGNALVANGNLNEGIPHFFEALRFDPHFAEAYSNLGAALFHQGRIKEAIAYLHKASRINPDDPKMHYNLKVALAAKKKLDDAIVETKEKLRFHPHDPVLHYKLGELYSRQGKMDNAIEHYQKAVSFKPVFPEAMSNLAILYVNKKEYDPALSLFKQIIEIVPDHAGTYYNIACIYALQHKTKESIDWLKEAIKKGYDNWDLIKTDKDLQNIRETLSYKEFITGH
ncbi:tetratricopeptide repeat protein [Thermodesulfobacteriota bacterium]